MDLIVIIIYILVFCGSFLLYRHMYNTAKTFTEKILILLLLLVYFSPLALYYFDRFDIGGKIFSGVDMKRWFDFASTYFSTIIGAIVSGVFLLLITRLQILEQRKDNLENTRIQNLPLLSYKIIKSIEDFPNEIIDKKMCFFFGTADHLDLYIKIDNLGLGTAKKIGLRSSFNDFYDNSVRYIDDYLSILGPKDSIIIKISITFDYKNILNDFFNYRIDVSYEDLLGFEYTQGIDLSLLKKKIDDDRYEVELYNCYIKDSIVNKEN